MSLELSVGKPLLIVTNKEYMMFRFSVSNARERNKLRCTG